MSKLRLCESEELGGIEEFYPRSISDAPDELLSEWMSTLTYDELDRLRDATHREEARRGWT